MIPSSLISDLRTLRPDQSPEQNLLSVRLLCRYLADNARELQLNDGRFIGDVVDFAEVLRQIANAARKAQNSQTPPPLVMQFGDWCDMKGVLPTMGMVEIYASDMVARSTQPVGPLNTMCLPVMESQPAGRLVVSADSGRPPQPHATCPHCPHVVHGTEPCQASMGTRMECGCQGSEGV